MKKITVPIIIILFLAGVWGGVALFGGNANATLAQKPLGDGQIIPAPDTARQLNLEEAVPVHTQENIVEETGLTQAEPESKLTSSTSASRDRLPENIPSDPVIDDFLALSSKFAAQYIKPGWLHLVYREEHPDLEGSSEIPEYGLAIPSTFISEMWYLLDANGLIVEGVSLMYDEVGQLIQVSVYRNRVWHNLTIGENMSVESAPRVRLDGRFLLHLEEAYDAGGQLTETEVLVAEQKLLRFTYEETFDPPIILSSSPKPMRQAQKSAYVDPDSGALLILETIFTTFSGQELVTLRTTLLTIENILPPDEILIYLEQIK